MTLNGTWNSGTSTCSVTGMATVQAGSTLTVPAGTTLADTSARYPFSDAGSVMNNGTIDTCYWNDFGKGVTTNATIGTFAVAASGTCHASEHEVYLGGQFQNYGAYSDSGTLVVDGYLAGASFTNYCGSTYSATGSVLVVLGGTLSVPSGCPQSISFSGPATGLVAGSYVPAATASSGLTVTFSLDVSSAGCSLSAGTVSFTGVGTCVVDADQTGNATYAAATTVPASTVLSAPVAGAQTISFGPLADRLWGSAPFTVSASATSGLAVSFSSLTPGVCQAAGTTVTLLTMGPCTIEATQPGNLFWLAAPAVDQTFNVVAGVDVFLPRDFRTERGSDLFVAFSLVDANNTPIPDAIARTGHLVVSFDGGPPVTAFYLDWWHKFLVEVPTPRGLAPGSYPLTVTSTTPSVPIDATTVQVRISRLPTRDTPWHALALAIQ